MKDHGTFSVESISPPPTGNITEVFNEPEHEQVLSDIERWLEGHLDNG